MINLLILFVLNFYFDGRVSNVTEHEFSVVYLEKCKVYTIRSPQVARNLHVGDSIRVHFTDTEFDKVEVIKRFWEQ